MLETVRGKEGLVTIGKKVIADIHPDKRMYKDIPEDVSYWVGTFLQKLRGSFPSVVLTNSIRGEGRARRSKWAAGGSRMQDWDPKDAGLMMLNQLIIDNMINAGAGKNVDEKDAFESFLFLMSITVAHELVHLFVGFISGNNRPLTPPDVSFLPEDYNTKIRGKPVGESGRAWEAYVLGGTVEAFEQKDNPLGNRQAGTMYLIGLGGTAEVVDQDYMRTTCGRYFQFPVTTQSEGRTTLQELDRTRRPMSAVRGAANASQGPSARDRDTTTMDDRDMIPDYTVAEPAKYRKYPTHEIREDDFEILLHNLTEPKTRVVKAR
ncbi:hypothetical protein G7054_g4585 [Neopestalotiopsis clavispora]|nr:hypothetical protein G7054_g4585 [Neopestalotiopsis clavispora]